MKQSSLFYKTKKEVPKEIEAISHKLLVKGDFIEQLSSGIYSFLPLGWKVHRKIERLVREEMEAIGAQEILMPALQPKEIWKKTKRWDNMVPPLFKLKDQHKREFALGPTHEEVITLLAKTRIESYRDLPKALFQIQNKFRNEVRATGGLLRTREFAMKDLYSFHNSEEGLKNYYQKVKESYFKIFKRCNLKVIAVEAEPGSMGGEESHEFMVEAESGEDKILICEKCGFGANIEKVGKLKKCPQCGSSLKEKRCIEESHVFSLGKKYSETLGAYFTDQNGEEKPLLMGCYGIGLGRLMATIVEVHHDNKGIIWPKEVAPFEVHLIRIEDNEELKRKSEKLYQDLQNKEIEVLYDDRDKVSPGEKLTEADLIGIPFRLVVSERTLSKNSVEVKKREQDKTELIPIDRITKEMKSRIKN